MTIYGLLRITDVTKKVNEVGEAPIFDAANKYLEMHNAGWAIAEKMFVEEVTEKYKFLYKLPSGGFLQRRGGLSRPAMIKGNNGWTVEIPLEGFGADLGYAKDEIAYMNMLDVQRVIDGIRIASQNSRRLEMLKAIYNNTARPFLDKWAGDMTIRPLAITSDGVKYPPVVGATEEATAQHYLVSGYAASAISDTNDPFVTMRAALLKFNGGGAKMVAFINSAQRAKAEALTDFTATADLGVVLGANGDVAVYEEGLPQLPGTLIGRVPGAWIAEWDDGVPANYIIMRDLEKPAPLMRRKHPAVTGISDGLRLVANSDLHPLSVSSYEDDFGYAATNRVGAVVMFLDAGASYVIPAIYA